MIWSASPHRLRGRSGRRWSSSARPSRSTIRSRSGSPTPVKAEARRSRVRDGRARRQRVELHAGAVGDRWALVRLGLDGNGDTRLEGKKPFGLPERHLDGRGRRRGDDLDCRRCRGTGSPTGQRPAPPAAAARCAPGPGSGPRPPEAPDRRIAAPRTRSARPSKTLFMIESLRASAAQRPPRFRAASTGRPASRARGRAPRGSGRDTRPGRAGGRRGGRWPPAGP